MSIFEKIGIQIMIMMTGNHKEKGEKRKKEQCKWTVVKTTTFFKKAKNSTEILMQ